MGSWRAGADRAASANRSGKRTEEHIAGSLETVYTPSCFFRLRLEPVGQAIVFCGPAHAASRRAPSKPAARASRPACPALRSLQDTRKPLWRAPPACRIDIRVGVRRGAWTD